MSPYQGRYYQSHRWNGQVVSLPSPWPATLPEQNAALANRLSATPQAESDLAARFSGKGKWKARLPELLATLATLGRTRQLDDGRWIA